MKKKDNPKNYTPKGHAYSCNNKKCELSNICFRKTYSSSKKVNWKESEENNQCINFIKWDLNEKN